MYTNKKETKSERFVRVAEARTNRAIDVIVQIGNMSKRDYYEYSEDQIEKIFAAIESEINRQKSRLLAKINGSDNHFYPDTFKLE